MGNFLERSTSEDTFAIPTRPTTNGLSWHDLQYHDANGTQVKKPNELESELTYPPSSHNEAVLNRIYGSMIGLAIGDALGAHVEFRPYEYLKINPVKDMCGGGTWSLARGQFTDDTTMALCLAISLISCVGFQPYNQLVRYKWWYKLGYMSSTGQCFDIGAGTVQSIRTFERRQQEFAKQYKIPMNDMDHLSDQEMLAKFDAHCGDSQSAGNGGLMRLAPVPLFFYQSPKDAVEYSGISGRITHGDRRVYDACRFYGALIVAALRGETKDDLLDPSFYDKHHEWFSDEPLDPEILNIVHGSYKKEGGHDSGICGKGFVVKSLEAALWAFWSDENSFKNGVLAAVNLGDDTDTTAAIYGQLAGAYYGYEKLPKEWVEAIYARKLIECLCQWIDSKGNEWFCKRGVHENVLRNDQ